MRKDYSNKIENTRRRKTLVDRIKQFYLEPRQRNNSNAKFLNSVDSDKKNNHFQ